MLWSKGRKFEEEPFEFEKDLEQSIQETQKALFGSSRIYLEVKKKIGAKGKTQNIPDAYLIDLTSKKIPVLYVVENELAKHDPLKHIAVQILQFSLSFESSPQKVKKILKDALFAIPRARNQCERYATENGYENVDYLLEQMINGDKGNSFNAMVIIDEVSDELEKVLISRFNFPVEIISLQRFKDESGKRLYQFDPFLEEISDVAVSMKGAATKTVAVDLSEIDTIVVPAQEEGFQETFIGENCWRSIRISSSMISRISYIAAYRVAPISSITHTAKVRNIERWKDTNKYILYFEGPSEERKPITLGAKGSVKAPQASRYTSWERLNSASTLDDIW